MSQLDKRIYRDGYIIDEHKARTSKHICNACKYNIMAGTQYYSIIKGGGGLYALKFPGRTHINCLDGFFTKIE